MSPWGRHAHDDRLTVSSTGPQGERWANLSIWWHRLALLALIAFLFYLPFLNMLPFAYIRTDLTSAGTDWAAVLFIIAVYTIVAVGLNVVIGLAGLLDLGYVGFFAIGAYSVALFGSPTSPVTNGDQRTVRPLRGLGRGVGRLRADRDRADHDLRRDPRRAHAAPARRLPRHRDDGLR